MSAKEARSRKSELSSVKYLVKTVIIFAVLILCGLLLYKNIAPFGATVAYKVNLRQGSKNISTPIPLTPSAFLGKNKQGIFYQIPQQKMTTEEINFNLKVPYKEFTEAKVSLEYQGDPDELLVGVLEPSTELYITKPIHNKSLNMLPWSQVKNNHLTLFQKKKEFKNVAEFLNNPPQFPLGKGISEKITYTSTYYYDLLQQPEPEIDKTKVNTGTAIHASLRGTHTFYLYVKGKPLSFNFIKHDLNQYPGEDSLNINIYRGYELIQNRIIPDDGNASGSTISSKPQPVKINIPGSEEGVYKVMLECEDDVLIKNLTSRQKYLSFEQKLFLADNKYYGIPTRENTVYAYGKEINPMTYHAEGLQTLQINSDQKLEVTDIKASYSANLPRNLNKITSPKSDIILISENNFFAFSEESLFDPLPVKIRPYSQDLVFNDKYLINTEVDYILADYIRPKKRGDWLINTATLDLNQVEPENKILSFRLQVLGPANKSREIILGSIKITLKKKGLFSRNREKK